MTTLKQNQRGFSFVEILMVLAVLALIVFLVMNYQSRRNNADSNNQTDSSQQAPDINNPSDLQNAEDELENVDVDSLDSSELDEDVDELL